MQKNVLEYLERTYKKFPNKIGYFDEIDSYTFQEIRERSRQFAMYILDHCNIRNQPIAVLLPKMVQSFLVFHGITYSGNIYVPIDINQPITRIEKILQTLDAKYIVVNDKTNQLLPDKYKDKIINYDEVKNINIDNVNDNLVDIILSQQISTDPLYIIFTSGSTGDPKGVVINHQSVIDYIDWIQEVYKYSSEDVIANQVPFYFDVSVTDIYMTLNIGCSLYIMPERFFAFSKKLLQELEDKSISVIFWVPSVLISIANSGLLESFTYKGLKKILFAGEVMPNKQLNVWRKYIPDALYSNLYGPTEITVIALYYIVNREFNDEEMLPMGHACRNIDVFLLDEDGKLISKTEINKKGELYIRGISVSSGYYNNPDKTNTVFIQNPLNNGYPEFVYKTGDIAYYNEYGELVYSCRKDYQIKHYGYRIELGEIETAVSSINEINNLCVLYDSISKQITLFYTSDNELDLKYIRQKLLNKLPKYALPTQIYYLKEMPLTPNGKINRQYLAGILEDNIK